MKTFAVFCACAFAYVSATSFPTMRFLDSSTEDPAKACLDLETCKTLEVGQSFYLPYCAKFICEAGEGGKKADQIQFCNNVPLDNPNCEVTNKQNASLPFPHCCPVFSCKDIKYEDDTNTRVALGKFRRGSQELYCPNLFRKAQGEGGQDQSQTKTSQA